MTHALLALLLSQAWQFQGMQVKQAGTPSGYAKIVNCVAPLSCSSNGTVWTLDFTGGTSGYTTIQNEGVALTQRSTVDFVGTGIDCVDSTTKTTCTVTSGSGSPGGSTGQVQFNQAGAFAGDVDFTFATADNRLTVGNLTVPGLSQGIVGTDASGNFYIPGTYAVLGWLGFVGGWDFGSNYIQTDNHLLKTASSAGVPIVTDTFGLKLRPDPGYSSTTYGRLLLSNGPNGLNYLSAVPTGTGTYPHRFLRGKEEAETNSEQPAWAYITPSDIQTTTGSTTWDPAPLAAGDYATQTLTVTGAVLGDGVVVSLGVALTSGMMLTGAVTSANTVTVTLWNFTSTTQDLASSTLKARLVP